jgi:hypothetical protein
VDCEPSRLDPPITAWQDFLLPLTDPSTHMNVSPWQRSTPPFFPLQGVLSAIAELAKSISTAARK